MKIFFRSHCGSRLLAGLLLAMGLAQSRAAEEVIIDSFDDVSGLTGWRFDYGGVTNLIEFDSTQDAANNPASGSMKVTFGFDAPNLSASGNNKGAVTIDLPMPLDGSTYVTMEMDLRIETGSAADGNGNSGFFQMVIRNGQSYEFNSQFGAGVTTNSGWRHISVSPAGGRDQIRAITLELFGGSALTGPVTFFVDNLKFTKPSSLVDVVVSQFNNAAARNGWRFDYGGVTNLIQFDATQDASNNPASGSLKVTFGFKATLNNNNKGAVTLDLPAPLDGSSYVSMEMDLKIAPGAATDGTGNSGFFQMVIRNGPFYDFSSQFGANVSTNDGWRHIRTSPLTGDAGDIRGITLELYGGATLTGPVTFYVDNLKFTTTNGPPIGPTMSMERPIRGLNLIPTSGQYQRQNIATVNSGYSWVGSPDVVTYAMTIHKVPDASHAGFQTHIFLVSGAPGADSAPDYSQPNVVFLDIQLQANGSAFAAFRYKTNEPAGNTFLYTAAPAGGTLGGLSSATPLGTWSMAFSQDTSVTVTAPDGTIGNFTMPPDAVAFFSGPLTVYLGDQPNTGGNVGQTVVLSRFQVTKGATTLLDDNFLTDQTLDPATWQVAAGNAAGVQLVGPDAAFWLSWTTPDSGFTLQTTTNITDPNSWAETGWVVPLMGSVKRVLVLYAIDNPDPAKIYAPDSKYSFFRLLRP